MAATRGYLSPARYRNKGLIGRTPVIVSGYSIGAAVAVDSEATMVRYSALPTNLAI